MIEIECYCKKCGSILDSEMYGSHDCFSITVGLCDACYGTDVPLLKVVTPREVIEKILGNHDVSHWELHQSGSNHFILKLPSNIDSETLVAISTECNLAMPEGLIVRAVV